MNKTSYIFVSSYFPYDFKENWISDEINAIPKDCLIYLIPRSKGKLITNDTNSNIKVIDEPIFKLRDIWECSWEFIKVIKYANIIYKHSNDLIDFLKRIFIIPKALRLIELFRNKECEHIHVYNTTTAASMALVIAKELNIPMSYTLHTTSQLNEKYKKNYEGLSLNCRFVRCVSKATQVKLDEFLVTKVQKSVISLGIKSLINQNKRHYDTIALVMVAALEEYKGIDIAIEAIDLIKQQGFQVKLDIFGEGTHRERIQSALGEKKLRDNIILRGAMNRHTLLNFINDNSEYSYIILTSTVSKSGQVEGIPVALMEGMDMGLIPIATDNGAIKELIKHEKNGILLSASSPRSVADEVIGLHALKKEVKVKISQCAQNTIQTNFNASKSSQKLISNMSKDK
ncbi:glycosyltransferase family 4 protein [Planktomarina temperata]|nr:glycosyltransferase family 4 protein [Planktomarina temperata]